jgi:DNA repair protein RecO (recombination protein O)
MVESATGLILRIRPLTETSLIVQWLTRESGRLATVAKGARRPKSPYLGKLDLFYLLDFSFARSRRSELHTLREVGLRETHSVLRRELGLLRQAAYCAALVEQTTETETPLPGMFELLLGLLRHLPGAGVREQTIFAFELKVLTELGLQPDPEEARLSDGSKRLLAVLGQGDWTGLMQLRLSPTQVAELRKFLHGFLVFHLGRIPGGRDSAINPAEL